MSALPNVYFVLFTSGGSHFCLPNTSIEEVLPIAHLSQPPGCPSSVEGILELAGALRPVIDLAKLFGLTTEGINEYTPMLVLRDTQRKLILRVDVILDIVDSKSGRITELSASDSFNGCCTGLYTFADVPYYILDVARLLTEEESALLRSYEESSIERLSGFSAD